jgi:transcriptional regulator with XRE-family HTH domain
MNMGDKLKHLRIKKGLTQEEVGLKIGLQKAAINKYEKGTVENLKSTTIKKLADLFEIEPSYFFFDDEKTPLVNNDEELTEYLEELKTRPEMKMLFKLAKGATKADVEKAVKIVEALFEDK